MWSMIRAAHFADRAGRQFNGNSRLFMPRPHGREAYVDLHEFLGAASGAELIAFRLHASQKLAEIFPVDAPWKLHALPCFAYAVELAQRGITSSGVRPLSPRGRRALTATRVPPRRRPSAGDRS